MTPRPCRCELAHDLARVGQIARAYDVPPWLIGDYHRPRFARLRWALRRVWPVRPKKGKA